MASDLFLLDVSPLHHSPELPDLDLQVIPDPLFIDEPFIFEALIDYPDPDPDPSQFRDATSFSVSTFPACLKMDTLSLSPLDNQKPLALDHLHVSPPPVVSTESLLAACSNSQGSSLVKQDSLRQSPLPCFLDSFGAMQRSLSSHSLDQIMPPIRESLFQPQFFSSLSQVPNQLAPLHGGFGFPSEPMRRICSTGDLPQFNGMQRNQGPECPFALEMSSTNFEESRFKVSRYSPEQREQRIYRYRSKRTQRNFNKKIKYECRKTLADSRNRIRGRFARNDETGEIPKAREEDDEEVDELHAVEGEFLMGKHGRFNSGPILGDVPICPKYPYLGCS